MNYAEIKYNDIANGTGVRTSLFVSGCERRCKGCFNENAWDFKYGKPFDDYIMLCLLKSCIPEYIEGLSILGGEPLHPNNIDKIIQICKRFKYIFRNKTIWIYTGYDYEVISKSRKFKVLSNYIDVLVDGEFIQDKKDLMLKFKGSSHQRIIDIKKSISEGKIVEVKI